MVPCREDTGARPTERHSRSIFAWRPSQKATPISPPAPGLTAAAACQPFGRQSPTPQAFSKKTNKDIGDILGLSPRTVNKHLEQVFVKLGVENRASAAIKATRLLLDPD